MSFAWILLPGQRWDWDAFVPGSTMCSLSYEVGSISALGHIVWGTWCGAHGVGHSVPPEPLAAASCQC